MGVVNITPDSFSDGGQFSDQTAAASQIDKLLKRGAHVIDIGAESTAPFNDPIEEAQERERLEPVLQYLQTLPKDAFKLSLDTYRPSVAEWFFSSLDWSYGLWNDVSGGQDEYPAMFLKKFPRHSYILCHSNVPQRGETSHHMNYVNEEKPITQQVGDHFVSSSLLSFGHRVLLDPCFGFSKTVAQNWQLLDEWSSLEKTFKDHHFVLGISKKSFLQKRVLNQRDLELEKSELLAFTELLHYEWIKKIYHSCERSHSLWVRTHEALTASLASTP